MWLEIIRSNKINLIWRLIAVVVTAAALACIILPVSYHGQHILTGNNDAVLLTEGFKGDSLNAYQNSRIYTTDRAILKTYPKAKFISPDQLKTDSPAIARLHVFGYGLTAGELEELGSMPIVPHAARAPDGISHISWNNTIKEGEPLAVQGQYQNTSGKTVRLVLNGFNTDLDTASLASGGHSFELTTTPKQTGRIVYRLLAISGADTLGNEFIPVEIVPVKPLNILILTSAPDFETRFLKNWLSQNGYGVAVRSAISKDKFVKEYVNVDNLPLDHLSAAVLDKFDVVLCDLSVLKSLNTDEGALLKQQVSQKGLGIIIRADSASKAQSWLQSSFPVDKIAAKDQVTTSFNIRGRLGPSSKLKIDPEYISFRDGTQPLVGDAQARTLVSSSQYGAGRLVFNILNNTFNWSLGGNKNDYTAFWSLLISKAARKEPVKEQWTVSSPLPTVNSPVNLRQTSVAQPAAFMADHAVISPEQDPLIPFERTGIYRPQVQGWHARQGSGTTYWWYAYGPGSWATIRALEKISDTRQYAESLQATSFVTKPLQQKVRIEIPKIYFYILLLAAFTFLWLEGKLNST